MLTLPAVATRTRHAVTPGGPTCAAGDARAEADLWPRTSRVLPWLVAAFIALLWLVPFNAVSLGESAPIDLYLDRLLLPPIVLIWLLAAVVGGTLAPRLTWTPIHTAVAGFVAVAFSSVVVNAADLNQALELSVSIKKLTLLSFYVVFFLIVASVVRPREVRAFMRYMLLLSILCAVGVIYEYHSHYNVFYEWSAQLLPGPFRVQVGDLAGVDEIGRRQTRGPAQLGLEAAAMMAMALPIALVEVLESRRLARRLLYGLAACLIVGAAISTYRKTAFMAPFVVFATLAYFRPRDMTKLAPFAVVAVFVVHALSPGALGAIADQLQGNRLAAAATVNDRKSDYDAIRPDVLTHPLLGRGYGSYEAASYRILDTEVLHFLLEVGFVGLVAYLLTAASVILAARKTIRSRRANRAPPALMAAAAAAAFLAVSTLFDAMSFPHTPYIFLTFAGLAAVVVAAEDE
jgi:hypothetical protein